MKKLLTRIMIMFMLVTCTVPLVEQVNPVQTVEAATVKINKKKATLTKGKTLQLKITGTKKAVKWSTSKKSVATVSKKGKVTAKKKGTATITAKVGNKKYTCKITVKNPSSSKKKSSSSSNVWASETGSKYHNKNDCGNMNPNKATKLTKKEAENMGLEPCSKCY